MARVRPFVAAAILLTLLSVFQNCSGIEFAEAPLASFCGDTSRAEVKPALLWDWKTELPKASAPRFETYDQVMASPMVADLDGDRLPEVVFVSFSMNAADIFADASPTGYRANGVLRMVDGRTGQTLKSIGSARLAPLAAQAPLLMDIDGDGRTEIFYSHYLSRTVIALNYDGSERWRLDTPAAVWTETTGLTGMNLDGQGGGEINFGPYIIAETAARLPYIQTTLPGAAAVHYSSIALPLDPSRPQSWSLVTPDGIYNSQGRVATLSGTGLLAAGDLRPDIPGLEIVGTAAGLLRIYNGLTGAVLNSVDLTLYNDLVCSPGVIGGGPPSIGDFDGDPASLEIAVATGRHLTIFDNQGRPKYKTVTQDCSSRVTGLTTFDLNQDGKPEILYADEERFRIFEIRSGKLEVVQSVVNPTATLYEYPVVADLMGQGKSSNIVLASNNYGLDSFYNDPGEAADKVAAAAITGVRAFRSTGDLAWAPTRPFWNQFSFHPSLVGEGTRFANAPAVDGKMFRRNSVIEPFANYFCR